MHIFQINTPPETTPSNSMPDGAVTGNGDLSVVWAGTTDRIRLFVGKSDFWKADGSAYSGVWGGISPLGIIEILLPQFPYSPYRVEQDMDRAKLTGYYQTEHFDAKLTAMVCACENTILLELDRSFPGLSASVNLLPLEGNDATVESGETGDMRYTLRGFDSPSLHFPTYGMCVLREISRIRSENREVIRWAVCVETNHDTASYRKQVYARARCLNNREFDLKINAHERWWNDFWSKSGVQLSDPVLEKYWYTGLYTMACCARNDKFPPGLWGNFATSDGMRWFGDYHLNYNYEAPFYALTASNHTELTDCYMSPLLDFIPYGKKYAKEYLGCRGIYYPVAIGPLGMETDLRPDTKEHGHLFLGQKSNATYAAVIPMMRWYATRDTEYAKKVYPYLRELADFWEDYLVYRDGKYYTYNDTVNEVRWFSGPDYMPKRFNDINSVISLGLVRMLMNLLIDIATNLSVDAERLEKWTDIAANLGPVKTIEEDGVEILSSADNYSNLNSLSLRYVFPSGQIGKYSTPKLHTVARNTLDKVAAWDSENTFCEFYPAAARVEVEPGQLTGHIKKIIDERGLENGFFRFQGGGIENSAAIVQTVNEMLMQSYEHIIRLFPCWDRTQDASFHGLRAYGAFIVNASVKNGEISAEIVSEKGQPLRLERPAEGYHVFYRGKKQLLCEPVTEFETVPGEHITLNL